MLKEHWKDCLIKYNEKDIFGLFIQGSQNYGMNTEFSDIDSKCLLLPSFNNIVFMKKPVSTTFIRENEEHIDFKDIRNYFNLFTKQNINVIEILFAVDCIVNVNYIDLWKELYSIREDVAHINMYKCCKMICGMSREKFKALCHPYPSKIDIIEKYGYDSKQLHHIIRLNDFIKRYKKGESFESCLIPTNKDYLLKIKTNEIVYTVDEAIKLATEYMEDTIKEYQLIPKMEDNQDTINHLDKIIIEIISRKLKQDII